MSVLLPSGAMLDVIVPDGCESGSTIAVETPPENYSAAERVEVTVPDGIAAGDTFSVQLAGGRLFDVTCPDGVRPGETLDVEVPTAAAESAAARAIVVRSYLPPMCPNSTDEPRGLSRVSDISLIPRELGL